MTAALKLDNPHLNLYQAMCLLKLEFSVNVLFIFSCPIAHSWGCITMEAINVTFWAVTFDRELCLKSQALVLFLVINIKGSYFITYFHLPEGLADTCSFTELSSFSKLFWQSACTTRTLTHTLQHTYIYIQREYFIFWLQQCTGLSNNALVWENSHPAGKRQKRKIRKGNTFSVYKNVFGQGIETKLFWFNENVKDYDFKVKKRW